MNIQTDAPAYILGQSSQAEFRLELLNELSSSLFIEALGVLPKRKVRILNIGCGSGHLEARLSTVFLESHFIGIDISAMRIEEARARTEGLKSSNTYEFIQGDLTNFSINELANCDILISRFVLSHLPNPIKVMESFLPLVSPGGFICFEEGASDCSEYYCNTKNEGYQTFTNLIKLQIQAQQSAFDTGFRLLSEFMKPPYKVLHSQLTQPILKSARHKSILRLGLEEAKSTLLKEMDRSKVEEIVASLREFEDDDQAFGLYIRTLSVVAQTGEKEGV